MKWWFILTVVFIFCLSSAVHAAALAANQNTSETMKAQVLEILSRREQQVPGTDNYQPYQTLKAKILSGSEKGEIVNVNDDYIDLKVGSIFYVTHTVDAVDSVDAYNVAEPYRMPTLYIVASIFAFCLLLFGGWQGIRGVMSLGVSILVLFYLFLPGVLHGYSPVLLSIGIASLIIVVGSYITHGFTKTTTSAVVGMIITIAITGLLAHWSVYAGQFSGYGSDATASLAYALRGHIDFVGLLLGSMLIGLLGVLYDAAIGQAVSVEELHRIGPHISRWEIYKRALRIGKEHIGALVNTLAIAYVGASLPLLLLFSNYITPADIELTANREIFASELLRIMIGSIGLILAVPITTLVAVFIIMSKIKSTKNQSTLREEEKSIKLVEDIAGGI